MRCWRWRCGERERKCEWNVKDKTADDGMVLKQYIGVTIHTSAQCIINKLRICTILTGQSVFVCACHMIPHHLFHEQHKIDTHECTAQLIHRHSHTHTAAGCSHMWQEPLPHRSHSTYTSVCVRLTLASVKRKPLKRHWNRSPAVYMYVLTSGFPTRFLSPFFRCYCFVSLLVQIYVHFDLTAITSSVFGESERKRWSNCRTKLANGLEC